MTTHEITKPPSTLPLMVKAALPAIPGVSMLPGIRRSQSTLPELEYVLRDVTVDRAHLTRYNEVCGFGQRDQLPATYPHMLAFPLHLAIMTNSSFPFAPMGVVHIENKITQHRPVQASETLMIKVYAADLRPHPKGQQFAIASEGWISDELVWEDVTTVLRRGGGSKDAGTGEKKPGLSSKDLPTPGPEWKLAPDLGRRYAAVSGDRNPIHLYPVTAKLFGFPRHIAHGMWSKARCLAAIENRLPDAFEVDVAFKKPILLPGKVAFGEADQPGGGIRFAMTDAKKDTPHVVGVVTKAS